MAKYTSTPATIARPQAEVYERLTDMTRLQGALDALPEEARAKVGDVHFDKDSITIITPQVGEIRFGITDRTPVSQIVFGTASSPVPLRLVVDIREGDSADTSVVTSVIDVEIPMMLRPLIGGKMQQAADQFGSLISLLCK